MTDGVSIQEVQRRMPAVRLIEDASIRGETIRTIADFPDYFWTAPATSSDQYHNKFARDQHGLWIHVLMASTAYEAAIDTYLEQNKLTEYEADLGRAAVLLHDGRKYGDHWRPDKSADKSHDLQMAEVVRKDTDLPDRVGNAIASHMGAWYKGPEPSTALEVAVHQADMMASARHGTWAVYHPPEELLEEYPDLPRAGFDDPNPTTSGGQRGLSRFTGGELP